MIFVRGKFYEDGVEVPLEFGNKTQQKFIEKIQELEGPDGVLCLDGESYMCTCGEIVERRPKGKTGTCWKCGNVFKWGLYAEDVPIIKLIHREI